ncbi:MAG TPA: hypothetical protein VM427_08405 [Patescibacteria group bacterium]|nr:hypothetical protein [Patescibacteria group bacterium]
MALVAGLLSVPSAALVPGTPLAAPIAAAAGGLTIAGDARYVVDPDKRRVHVAVRLLATNHRTDTKTRRFYYDRAFLAVQPGTTGFKVTSSGAKPVVRVTKKATTYTLLRIDFGKQLAAGASRTFNLAFDIVDPGGAATRTIRIGQSLVTFGAWGFGSEGSPGGSVSVVFPPGFAIDVAAPGLAGPAEDAAGNTTFSTGRLSDPLSFFASFVADRPGSYTETALRLPIGDRTIPITLRAWPDDPTWAARVGDLLTRGLPALADDIGLPWTVDQPLIVEEAVSRTASGFSGRYDPPAGRIEIAYYATPYVVLHEAAHAWFDGGLLADRWASEGFASFYAGRTAAAIGEEHTTGDELTPALEKARIPLNAWAQPGAAGTSAVDEAEYAAALKLASLVAERAGADDLSAVWRAIHERRAAYQPIGPQAALETADAAPDWRGLLDLLEERTGASYDDLWAAWVVRPSETRLLADRSAARALYAETTERAATWRLPRVVRDALRVWQYDQATELLVDAGRALDDRDRVLAAAAAAGLVMPDTMRTAFEGPRGFAAAAGEADAELAAIAAYTEARATAPADPTPLQRIGLWNSNPERTLEEAAAAFGAGDLRGTVEAAAFARTTWRTAGDIGRNRVVAIVASLAAILLGGWLALRWLHDRGLRRRSVMTREG